MLTKSRAWRLTTSSLTAAVLVTVGGVPSSSGSSTTTTPGASTATPSTSTSDGTGGPDASGLAEPQTSSEGVEVATYGVVTVRPYQDPEATPVTMAVHGVRRVDGATVVYFSAGWSQGDEPDAAGLSELSAPGTSTGGYTNGGDIGSVRITDVTAAQVHRTVATPGASGFPNGFGSDLTAFPSEPGVMGTMFAVLPELPETTTSVDVQLLWGATVAAVPVEEGLLEPTAEPEGVIPLGTAWPEIDTSLIAEIEEPQRFTHPLSSVVEALDDSQVVTEQGDTITVDLAADVLFAFDKADLNPAARTKLAEVAASIKEGGATGAISIVGHTDDQGSDSYNLDLSRRRAQSVAAVLQPALRGLPVTFAVDGKGESEPVADNGSEEGRQANRRVAVTYTLEGDS